MNRIANLRVRIIVSILSVLALVFALAIIFLNASIFYREVKDSQRFLQTMARNEGYAKLTSPMRLHRLFRKFPKDVNVKPALEAEKDSEIDNVFPIRLEIVGFRTSFSVKLSTDNQILDVIHLRPLAYTDAEIKDIVKVS